MNARTTVTLTSLLFLVISTLVGCDGATGDGVESYKVVRVIDGDTLVVEGDKHVRLLGVDTPERGQCGYREAKDNLERLTLSKRIILVKDGKQQTDRYGRLLRYVEIGPRDVGMTQIKNGLADARYDSRDGYPKHSRQDKYIKLDQETQDICPAK